MRSSGTDFDPNAVIPSSPPANSVNERIKTMDDAIPLVSLKSTTVELAVIEGFSTENTYTQIIASTAAAANKVVVSGTLTNPSATGRYQVYLATGGAGSEVVNAQGQYQLLTSTLDDQHSYTFTLDLEMVIPAGTRLAIKFDRIGGVGTVELYCGVSIFEV